MKSSSPPIATANAPERENNHIENFPDQIEKNHQLS